MLDYSVANLHPREIQIQQSWCIDDRYFATIYNKVTIDRITIVKIDFHEWETSFLLKIFAVFFKLHEPTYRYI